MIKKFTPRAFSLMLVASLIGGVVQTASGQAANIRSKIDNDVFEPYTRKQYPKAFEKYGKRMPDLERARQAAAYLAATSASCDRVTGAEISLMNSTVQELDAFADCANKERFRYREPELKNAKGQFFTEKTVRAKQ